VDGIKEVAPWLFAVAATLWNAVLWFGRRDVKRYDDALTELAALKQQFVTHAELDKMVHSHFQNALEEFSATIQSMHGENRGFLIELRQKIDAYEDRDSRTRHDIRNTVNTLLWKVAIIAQHIEKQTGTELPDAGPAQ
jgi:ABC-type transporter Mla subunit MlaD